MPLHKITLTSTRPSFKRIPKIIHHLSKTNEIPVKYMKPLNRCVKFNPDYKFTLWTDITLREFIVEFYPSFVKVYDGYRYPIQRVDAVRYFILLKYGGIYLDLDVGCLRSLDPLLGYEVVVPKTKVSLI